MDTFAAEHGWLDEQGEPRGFAKLYVSMLNAERLAIGKLEAHLRARSTDAVADLQQYLDGKSQRAG